MRVLIGVVLCCAVVIVYFMWPFKQHHNLYRRNLPKKPNIIFILADDLGWSDVGYNNPYVITPNIDELAREGVILNQSYVSQQCGPSRSALMTGYYSYRLGFQTGGIGEAMPFGLPLKYTTLPEKMQKLGYATYMVGKWHLGFCKRAFTPNRRGFDRFYGFYESGGDHYEHTASGYLDLRDDFEPDWSKNGTYSSHLFSDKAVEFINRHDKTKPLFLYLAYQNIHVPLQVPQIYLDKYHHVKNGTRRYLLAMSTAMDDGIGKLVKTLKKNEMWNNTVIVFSTDNGAPQNDRCEGNNWPLLGTKHTLYEGGTRGVGFVHGGMLNKTGYTYNGMIHIVDWYPTLVGIAGGKKTDFDMDGIDVWSALSRNETSPRKEIVYNINIETNSSAIRYGDFKLHELSHPIGYNVCWNPPPEAEGKYGKEKCIHPKRGFYLYNLKDDPLERFNLAEKMPDKVKELRKRLEEKGRQAVPAFSGTDSLPREANPENFGGVWSPGWC